MKKLFVKVAVSCVVLLFCSGNAAMALLINQEHFGDRVVYDACNDLYWYPILTDFIGMTRSEQEEAIELLEYGGISDWEMATYDQTTALKFSLASMGDNLVPTKFGDDFGTEILEDREFNDPYLAWGVRTDEFFNPSFVLENGLSVLPDGAGSVQVFNGRTTGEGWTNMGEHPVTGEITGFGGPVVYNDAPADDHWVAHSWTPDGILTGCDEWGAMTFNQDQHYLDDMALYHDSGMPGVAFPGEVSAWVVSETAPVPEPASFLLFGAGLLGLVGFSRKFRK